MIAINPYFVSYDVYNYACGQGYSYSMDFTPVGPRYVLCPGQDMLSRGNRSILGKEDGRFYTIAKELHELTFNLQVVAKMPVVVPMP